jgi:hypothetical protein
MRTEGKSIGVFRMKRLSYVLLNVFLIAFFLTGCQGRLFTYEGKTIEKSAQIMIKKDGQQSGQYTSSDLTVDYKYTAAGQKLQISGVVKASKGVAASFTTVDSFYLGLLLGDAQGNILREQALATYTGAKMGTGLDFNITMSLHPQAACMAFMYNGEVVGDGSTPYYFSRYPIAR